MKTRLYLTPLCLAIACAPAFLPAQSQDRRQLIIDEPDTIGQVYLQEDSGSLRPLERSRAVPRSRTSALSNVPGVRSSSTLYWEMSGARSPVRIEGGKKTSFIVRLPEGVSPGIFQLFPLETKKDMRLTRTDAGNRNAVLTLPVTIRRVASSSFGLTPVGGDLPLGEYSFSAAGSNDAYCFGVDPPGATPARPGPVSTTGESSGTSTAADFRNTTISSSASKESAVTAGRGDETDAIISAARSAAMSLFADLPPFTAQQTITRYTSANNGKDWSVAATANARFTAAGGRVDFPNPGPSNGLSWPVTEFQTRLLNVLSPAAGAGFVAKGQTRLLNRVAIKFDYMVDQPRSRWTVQITGGDFTPAYRGTIWVDQETRSILRLEMRAFGIPRDLPVDTVETALDFGFVSLDGRLSVVPIRGENLSCTARRPDCTRITTEFHDYNRQ